MMNYQDGSLQLNNTLFNALLIAYNEVLHLTGVSLRSKSAGELGRYKFKKGYRLI